MQRKDRIDSFGAAILIAQSAVLGLNQVMIKLVNVGLQPVFQAGLRSLCAILPILLFAIVTRKKLSLRDGTLGPGILTGLFFTAEFTLLFQALDYTTVSRASIFFYTMPFWVALGAHSLIPGERLTSLRILGLFLAFAGVVLALSGNEAPATANAFIGDIMCLIAAAFWAALTLCLRTTKLAQTSPEMQLLYHLVVSAIVLLAIAPLFGDLIRAPTVGIVAIFGVQVLLVVFVGFLAWFWILSIYPASSVASFSFLAPVFGVFFGWLVLGETITWRIAGALVLVGVGLVLVNRRTGPQPAGLEEKRSG